MQPTKSNRHKCNQPKEIDTNATHHTQSTISIIVVFWRKGGSPTHQKQPTRMQPTKGSRHDPNATHQMQLIISMFVLFWKKGENQPTKSNQHECNPPKAPDTNAAHQRQLTISIFALFCKNGKSQPTKSNQHKLTHQGQQTRREGQLFARPPPRLTGLFAS